MPCSPSCQAKRLLTSRSCPSSRSYTRDTDTRAWDRGWALWAGERKRHMPPPKGTQSKAILNVVWGQTVCCQSACCPGPPPHASIPSASPQGACSLTGGVRGQAGSNNTQPSGDFRSAKDNTERRDTGRSTQDGSDL